MRFIAAFPRRCTEKKAITLNGRVFVDKYIHSVNQYACNGAVSTSTDK